MHGGVKVNFKYSFKQIRKKKLREIKFSYLTVYNE